MHNATYMVRSLRKHNIIFCPEKNIHWTSISATALGIVFHNNKLCMVNNNIHQKIDAFNQCLKSWSKWNLTLIGKNTTFAVPKLIYPLTVIESPSKAIVKKVETSMFQVFWNCKPDEIKRDQISHDYNDGGLTMIDISSLNKALKASWVKRILKRDSKLSLIYKTELKQFGETIPFKCNVKLNLLFFTKY